MLRWLSLLMQLLGASAAGSTAPATGPGTTELTLRSLELKVVVPTEWKASETESDDSVFSKFAVDNVSTTLIVGRKKAQLRPEEMKGHVDARVDHHRQSLLKNNGKIVRDEKLVVAGGEGKLLEADLAIGGQTMRMLIVYFTLNNREYSITAIGQKDFYTDARPQIMRMVDSMKPSAAGGQKTP